MDNISEHVARFNWHVAPGTLNSQARGASFPMPAANQGRWSRWKICPRCGCFCKQQSQLAAAIETWTITSESSIWGKQQNCLVDKKVGESLVARSFLLSTSDRKQTGSFEMRSKIKLNLSQIQSKDPTRVRYTLARLLSANK